MKEDSLKMMSDQQQKVDLETPDQQKKEQPGQAWLMTYADMMTLLFAFFVMLYAMSSPDPVKISQIEDAMKEQAGFESTLQSQGEIKEEIEEIIESLDVQNVTNIIQDPRGVAIEMDGDICFDSGSTTIRRPLVDILNGVAERILSNKDDFRMVIVEGHTDSQPIPKELKKIYPTNWELSAARASNVVNYLIKQGVNSGRLQASGYADRWPAETTWLDVRSGKVNNKIIAENNATKKQMQKNRRIKVVFTNN